MREVAGILLKATDDKCMGVVWLHVQSPAIEAQEDISGKKGNPLFAINERMIHQQRLE